MYDRNCCSLPTFCQSNDDSRLDDNKTVNEIKIVIYNLNKHFIHIYVCVYIYIYIYIYKLISFSCPNIPKDEYHFSSPF